MPGCRVTLAGSQQFFSIENWPEENKRLPLPYTPYMQKNKRKLMFNLTLKSLFNLTDILMTFGDGNH